jgi:UDP-N-acetylglucosamine:LPS N-acetylglucosamine transferase
VAPITDMADFAIWSHRGVDSHLVMHEDVVARVERYAGRGSAAVVGPLVARRFLLPRDTAAARTALGLAPGGRLVAVSGGAWGVGDLGGATDAALAAGAERVVLVTGRNAAALTTLRRRFAADPRVSVCGFTDRMDDLMRAADVIVHATGGVTSMEAMSCGCPMIAYGCSLAHIRVHNRSMAALGLLTVAEGTAGT